MKKLTAKTCGKKSIINVIKHWNNKRSFLVITIAALTCNTAFAQLDSLNEPITFDRFGNVPNPQDLIIPSDEDAIHHSHQCTAGYFRLTFMDRVLGTNVGFDDPTMVGGDSLGQLRINLACQVFTDLAELLAPAVNPCDGSLPVVEIQVLPSITDTSTSTVGIASSYYRNFANSGIIHGEVFKNINGAANSLNNLGGTFHGYLAVNFAPTINWHLDLDTLPPGNKYDLYSLILHEVSHLLGFGSLINFDGNSKLTGTSPGLYSKFDTYLRVNGGNYLINNFDSCYTVGFNADTSFLTLGCPNIIFDGINAGQQFVYAPANYMIGSSLSHFDDNCPSVGANDFVMNSTLGLGEMNRVPTPGEVKTLCDIGYEITGIFGDSTLFFHTDTLPVCGTRIAGVNDFGPTCSPDRFIIRDCDTLTITDILNNDEYAVLFECLEVISGNGNVSATTGTSFDFFPNSSGLITLRYIPVGAGGERGNITYVFILVTPCQPGCIDPVTCNLICNSKMNISSPYQNSSHIFAFSTDHNHPAPCSCGHSSHIPG